MPAMEPSEGLRERKKQKTRKLIAETARRLFAERSFEAVSVSEIARAAEVSEATVFNYFAKKDDLVFEGMALFEGEMLKAVRERPSGESVVRAFGRFAIQTRGALASNDPGTAASLTEVSRLIAASPTLRAREREILAGFAHSLAELIGEEIGAREGDLRPVVVAHALIGLHSALISFVRQRVLDEGSSADLRKIGREVQSRGKKALEPLEAGLHDFAIKT